MSIQKVWMKENLPTGDLQLLTNSHASGVLRLTQANNNIDQTTYFRSNVFGTLLWRPINGKEMASAKFRIVIDGISRGIFCLDISHKPSWEANQNNYTTGLHWGDAISQIQLPQLIGKTLTLSVAIDEIFDYQINID